MQFAQLVLISHVVDDFSIGYSMTDLTDSLLSEFWLARRWIKREAFPATTTSQSPV